MVPERLTESRIDAAGDVLARAFADDPFFVHVLADPRERERLMSPFMRAHTRYGHLFGEVYTIGTGRGERHLASPRR